MQQWSKISLLEGKEVLAVLRSKSKLTWLNPQAFLLFENLDRSTWTKTLLDAREAFAALKRHFLKDLENPDDLSAADPLADDEFVSPIVLTPPGQQRQVRSF